MNKFWLYVWLTAERLHINLGPAAPWVFGKMVGSKGQRIK